MKTYNIGPLTMEYVFRKSDLENMSDMQAVMDEVEAALERYQRIIDGRPAINAGLPETYVKWSQSIYAMEAIEAIGVEKN